MGIEVRKLSWLDTLRFQLHVSLFSVLLGLVVPNRWFLSRAAKRRDTAAMRLLRDLRDKYGCEHLWTRFPFRRTLLVLAPDTIDAVLLAKENSPDPFVKKFPLSRFIPDALLVSSNAEAENGRRAFNTAALDLEQPIRHAETFAKIAIAEAERMTANRGGGLRWPDFQRLGERVSQQVILGAGEVHPELAEHLARMVRFSNWFVRRGPSFAAFYARVDALLRREPVASPACLMHGATSTHGVGAKASTRVASQVGFWFFVLKDVVELHVARTLALIAAHPEVQARVRLEVRAVGTLSAKSIEGMHYLDRCIAEQLRLWTPVPLLLRRADERFLLRDDIAVDCEQQMLIHAGFYHRDPRVFGELADRYSPDAAAARDFPAVYNFSAHGRRCAGRTLAMFVLKATLASLLSRFRFELVGPGIDPGRIAYLYDHFCIDLLPVPDA